MKRARNVPVRFVDDGFPEATEYDNNYYEVPPGGWRLLRLPVAPQSPPQTSVDESDESSMRSA